MTTIEIHEYLASMPDVWLDFPFGEETSVYKIGKDEQSNGKMFALVADTAKPLRVSLKCDPGLAERLRDIYETVLPGHNLSKKHWNTILITGQVPDDELKSLMQLSYRLASGNES